MMCDLSAVHSRIQGTFTVTPADIFTSFKGLIRKVKTQQYIELDPLLLAIRTLCSSLDKSVLLLHPLHL